MESPLLNPSLGTLRQCSPRNGYNWGENKLKSNCGLVSLGPPVFETSHRPSNIPKQGNKNTQTRHEEVSFCFRTRGAERELNLVHLYLVRCVAAYWSEGRLGFSLPSLHPGKKRYCWFCFVFCFLFVDACESKISSERCVTASRH